MDERLKYYIEKGKYELALNLINKIIKKSYSLENINYRAIIYLFLKKYEAALIDLNEINNKIPNNTDIYCNLGIANKGLKKFNQAILFFQKSLDISPQNFNSLFNLVETYLETYNFKNALLTLDKILVLNPNIERVYQLKAFCFRELNKYDEHHDCLIKAIGLNKNNYENYYHLGFSFIWKRDKSNAIQSFKESYRLNSNFIASFYQLNKLEKFSLSSIEFKNIENLDDKNLDSNNQSYKYLLISDIFYENKDIINFFKNLHKANYLKNSKLSYKKFNHQPIKNFYKKILSFKFKQSDPTPIFIIGMPRSGSSLIEQVLSKSNDIYAAGEIPILHEYFKNLDLSENLIPNINSLEIIKDKYINFLSNFPKKKFIVDKLPLNFFWIGLIKTIFPNAIFIHSIRNKTDICMSLYRTFFADGVLEFSYSQKNIIDFYSCYKDMILFWRENNIDIIDVNYSDLVENPEASFKKLFKALNITFDESFLNLESNNRPVKTASSIQITNKLEKLKYPKWALYNKEIPLFLQD